MTRFDVVKAIVKSRSGKLAKVAYAKWAYDRGVAGQAMEDMGMDENTFVQAYNAHRALVMEETDRGRYYALAYGRLVGGIPTVDYMDETVYKASKFEAI